MTSNGSMLSLSSNSNPSVYTPTTSYSSSPVTPRRSEPTTLMATTPEIDPNARKRSNSATDKETEKDFPQTSRSDSRSRSAREARNKDGLSNPMKSFRVNVDDPCYKVLPAAMKKYNVRGKEEDYRLYITYGDIGISTHLDLYF